MNKIYRIVWNEARGAFVVAHEKSKAKGKPASTRKAISLAVVMALAALAVEPAMATPIGQAWTSGDINNTIGITGTTTGIKASGSFSGSIINSGSIQGIAKHGIYVTGSTVNGGIVNSGQITGSTVMGSYGIFVGGPGVIGYIHNTCVGTICGTISGSEGIFLSGLGSVTGGITNSGSISGVTNGIGMSGGFISGGVLNSAGGMITGGNTGINIFSASSLSGGITNSGLISGGIAGIGIQNNSSVSGGITNSGSIMGTTGYGVWINNAIVTGGIINTTSGTTNGTISGQTFGIFLNYSSLSGSLTNSGTISGSGTAGSAIYFEHSSVSGSLINSGTIIGSGRNGIDVFNISTITGGIINNSGSISGGYVGINIKSHSSVTGGITNNSGSISGGNSGIYIQGNSSISDGITNSGSISGNSNGIYIRNISSVSGGIINSGSISGNSNGIYIRNNSGVLGDITNSGTIIGSGGNGINISSTSTITGGIINTNSGTISGLNNGIRIHGSSYTSSGIIHIQPSNITGGITNAGTISGGTYGILMTFSTLSGGITNSGTISGNTYAISSDAASTLGDIHNQSGGLISGALNILSNTNVTNAGMISLPEATASTITGNYVQTSTGVFQISASNTTTGTYGKLNVTGTATLPTAAKIYVQVNGSLFCNGNDSGGGGTLAGVISAGTLSATTFSVTDSSALVDFVGVKNGNSVDLTVVAEGAGSGGTPTPTPTPAAPSVAFEGSVNAVGATPSAGAANVFDRLLTTSLANGSTGNTDMDAVLNTIIASYSATQQQISNVVSQTLPLHTGGETAAITGSLHSVNHIVQSRQEGQQGRSSGDAFYEDGRAWAKPFGSVATQGDYNGVSGFSAVTGGIVFGADAEIRTSNRLGIAVAVANTDVSGNSSIALQSSNVATYQLAVYGSHSFDEVTDINYQADMGEHINKGYRRIVFMGTTAQSNYHSLSEHVGVGVAHTLILSEISTFTPSMRADYTTVLNTAYTETGAGALNLNVDKSVVNEILLTADGKFTRKVEENTTLTANLGVSYDALAKQNSITSAYAGDAAASFTTLGLNASPWLARGGLGFVRAQNGTEVTLRYDVDARSSHFVDQTVSAKVRWAF